MNIIKDIITDYEKLIKTDIKIPLSNGDIIRFVFQPQDLPHLLGLKYLSDNPVLFEYSEKRLSASELYNRMCGLEEPVIDTDEFENSIYFPKVYEGRIKYFSSDMILDIIRARQIVRFNPKKIKNFTTKLEKIEYMFWKEYKLSNNRYGYFGIGFMSSGTEKDVNYPNTFFFRMDDEYINNQEQVLPYSFMKKDKQGNRTFEIYWDEVWLGLRKNAHYRKLIPKYVAEDGSIAGYLIETSNDEDAKKHYELLQLDALDCVYLPYMKDSFRWTNDEKRYLWSKIKESRKDYLPNEIKQLLNEYRQSQKMIDKKYTRVALAATFFFFSYGIVTSEPRKQQTNGGNDYEKRINGTCIYFGPERLHERPGGRHHRRLQCPDGKAEKRRGGGGGVHGAF